MTEQRANLRKYIVPAMIGNLSFFILTIVDGMFVGNGVGADALGAVSIAMPFVNLVWALSTLFNIGGVAVAAVEYPDVRDVLAQVHEAGGIAVLLTGYLPLGAVLIAALAVPVGWLQYGGEAGALLLFNAGIMLTRHWPGLVRMYRGEEPQFFRPKH